jgi:folate-binding protein YgfZ
MKQWHDFIETQPETLVEENFICDASELGLILVTGDDAQHFLQNQLSSDITLIDETRHQLSSYSTPKGRMLGIFRVIRISNGYILVTTRAMVTPLLQKLFHYVLQSQVNLADASDHFARFAMQTDNAEIAAHPLLAREPGATLQNDSLISIQLEPLALQRRYLVLCLDAGEAINLWRAFAETLQPAGFDSWRLADIRAGIPSIYPDTAEEFVLQMANLTALGGVSFKKGCYPGQEIVARMQYLGKLKRRMFLARLETGQLPRPGDELVATGKQEADGSGKIVDAAFDSDGVCHCLYIAQIARAESGDLQLLSQPETRIENVNLPYPLAV